MPLLKLKTSPDGLLTHLKGVPMRPRPAGSPTDPCVYCTLDPTGVQRAGDTWEHVIPRSAGGLRIGDGLAKVRACRHHNMQRSSKPLLHYLLQLKEAQDHAQAGKTSEARTAQKGQ